MARINESVRVHHLGIIQETTDAILVRFEEDDQDKVRDEWLPKSQLDDWSVNASFVEMPAWLCEDRELDDYAETL